MSPPRPGRVAFAAWLRRISSGLSHAEAARRLALDDRRRISSYYSAARVPDPQAVAAILDRNVFLASPQDLAEGRALWAAVERSGAVGGDAVAGRGAIRRRWKSEVVEALNASLQAWDAAARAGDRAAMDAARAAHVGALRWAMERLPALL